MSTMTTETATMILTGIHVLFGALAENDYLIVRGPLGTIDAKFSERWWKILKIEETRYNRFLTLQNSAGEICRIGANNATFYLHRYSARLGSTDTPPTDNP